jgi:deoxyribonuclease-4
MIAVQKGKAIRLGVHISIAGGVEEAIPRAADLGCSAIQIFSRNPRGWKAAPLDPGSVALFRERAKNANIDPVIVHTPYLLNLASGDRKLHRQSINGLFLDVQRASQLGARFVVTHLGSAREQSRKQGIKRIIEALREVLSGRTSVSVLLENGAGAGNSLGSRFEELAEIIEGAGRQKNLGVCFDSCHGFASGYDLRSPEAVNRLADIIRRTIGRRRLFLLHLNDCAGTLGGHLDRHEHIGKGKIGMDGFRDLLGHPCFRGLPMILETPKDHPDADRKNLIRIRRIYFSKKENVSLP